MNHRAELPLALLLVITWAGCRPAVLPPGEWDEPCVGQEPQKEWVHGSNAEEAAGMILDVTGGLKVHFVKQGRYKHWGSVVEGVVVERHGSMCSADRRTVWWRHAVCKVQHQKTEISASECRDFFACTRAATPPEAEGMRDCDPFKGPGADMGMDNVVELSSDGRYRGCRWYEPPPCVREEKETLLWPGSRAPADPDDSGADTGGHP